ncbi:MAG: hypothetical protein ABEI98_07790 [Halorhabdus sp.]
MSEPRESSPSTGWRETAEAMDVEGGIPEYVEEHREDLEAIAEEDYPISPVAEALLRRLDRRDA